VFRPAGAAPEVIGMSASSSPTTGGDQALAQVVAILNAHQQDPRRTPYRGPAAKPVTMLLADRDTGNLVTIFLWDTQESVRPIEARAAQLTNEAAESIGVATDPVKIYQVEIARLA
jgi:hypothetical protein